MESSAGTGNIIKAVNAVRKDVKWAACELRLECEKAIGEAMGGNGEMMMGDFLKRSPPPYNGPYAASISNVPFSRAQEFIEHTLAFALHVIHLLRLNYLGTEKRNKFFRENCPDVYVIPDRVSFALSVSCPNKKSCGWEGIIIPLEAGKDGISVPSLCPQCESKTRVSSTDSIEYCWMHWGPERGRRSGKIEVLDHTPVEQRR